MAAGPSPPVTSSPKGMKFHPAPSHATRFLATFCVSASAAAVSRGARTATEAEGRSGCTTVTSTAVGRLSRFCSSKSAGLSGEFGRFLLFTGTNSRIVPGERARSGYGCGAGKAHYGHSTRHDHLPHPWLPHNPHSNWLGRNTVPPPGIAEGAATPVAKT